MFTIEYRINGALIAVLYGHNEGVVRLDGNADAICRYTWRYTEVDTGRMVSGEIEHLRPLGLLPLATRIASATQEKIDAESAAKLSPDKGLRRKSRGRRTSR